MGQAERIRYAELACTKLVVWKFLPSDVSHPHIAPLGRPLRLGLSPRGCRLDITGGHAVVLWLASTDHEYLIGDD